MYSENLPTAGLSDRKEPFRGRGKPRGRSRGSYSRRGYNDNRYSAFRREKGEITMNNKLGKIKEDLYVGTDLVLRSLTLSITTRGIGFGLCITAYQAIMSSERIFIPSIYEQYRVCLGLVECKLEAIRSTYPIPDRMAERLYQMRVTAGMKKIAEAITLVPEPVKKIINAIGVVKHDDKLYYPGLAPVFKRGQRVVPQPDSLVLSKLRETVLALNSLETPLRERQYFREHCPIPGVNWSEDNILMNPDEIIPEHYDVDMFAREGLMMDTYMTVLQKYMPKLVAGNVDYKSTGALSLFVANNMENLRSVSRQANEDLTNYYKRCVPLGDVKGYRSYIKLSSADRLEGEAMLLGEYPDTLNIAYPVYNLRDDYNCAYG